MMHPLCLKHLHGNYYTKFFFKVFFFFFFGNRQGQEKRVPQKERGSALIGYLGGEMLPGFAHAVHSCDYFVACTFLSFFFLFFFPFLFLGHSSRK
jgi:hypothetical protein